MGLDLEIHIALCDGCDVPNNNTGVEGHFVEVDNDVDWHIDYAVPSGATHVLSSMTRYYGVGYERGPWPQVSALLLELLMDERVEGIWYGHDSGSHSEVTSEWLTEMNNHYVNVGHEPYCGERRR